MGRQIAGLKELLQEIRRFSGPGEAYLWHQNITGVNLNPHQLMYSDVFEREARIIVKGSRRIRKSFAVAAHYLKEASCKPFSEINIFAPAIEQSKRNIRYMTNMVMQSPVLSRFIERRSGGLQLGKESITFRNGSIIQAKGQASSVDGLGSTHIWLEELDDMDWDVLQTRILPTGAQIKDNYDYGQIGQCQIIASGTIKGQFILYRLEHPDPNTPPGARYVVAPVFDCWDGVAMGIISEDFIEAQRAEMTMEQFQRTYLCLYTEAKNFFPTRYLHRCLVTHVHGTELVYRGPSGVGSYKPWGTVYMGLDFAGQGQQEGRASNTAATFVDMIEPGVGVVLWVEEFGPLAPPQEIRERLRGLMKWFRPSRGVGDAYDSTLIYNICEDAYRLGLTKKNPAFYEHGEGVDGWESWYVVPVHFSGPRKHKMYSRAQKAVYERRLLFPPVVKADRPGVHEPSEKVERLMNQMEGIIASATQGGYDKYEPANRVLGDDLVDALVAALEAGELFKAPNKAYGGPGGGVGGGFADLQFHTPTFHEPGFRPTSSGLLVPEHLLRLGMAA